MSIEFNADEVFEIAEQIERNGAIFYRSVAEKVADSNKKQLLLDLAEMEDEHEQTFKNLRSELSQDEKTMTTFDPEDEAANYLRALAETRVFYEKKLTPAHSKRSLRQLLPLKKTLLFFILE